MGEQVKGSFARLEELLDVPGIGRNVLDQNKGILVCKKEQLPDLSRLPSYLQDDEDSHSGLRVLSAAATAELGDLPLPQASKCSSVSSRRSSRRSSHQPADISASQSCSTTPASAINTLTPSTTRSSRISPSSNSAKRTSPSYRLFSNSAASGSSSSAHLPTPSSSVRTRNRLEQGDNSLGALSSNQNSSNSSHDPEDDMDFSCVKDYCKNNSNRLSLESSSTSPFSNTVSVAKSYSNGSNYLLADGLREAELNKLRVRENNYAEDMESQSSREDVSSVKEQEETDEKMHEETSEELADALRRNTTSRIVASSAILGSDTPYEEPSESNGMEVSRYSPNTVDLERVRGGSSIDYFASAGEQIISRNFRRRKEIDGCHGATSSNSLNLSSFNRNRNCANGDDNDLLLSYCKNVGNNSNVTSMDRINERNGSSEASIICVADDSNNQYDECCDDEEEEDENDQDDEIDSDEEVEDKVMIVEMPMQDKKQVKRKYEVGGGELRALLPVKKSCKAEEHCLASPSPRRHPATPPGLSMWLGTFSTWSPQEKLTALDSLIGVCNLNQVRHVHQIILPTFQRDFISLLPKELALYVLSYLSPKDLLKAAQTCKYWNMLTADNLLWREKCKEAGIDNFLDHMDKRRRKGTCAGSASPYKKIFMQRHLIECNWRVNPLKVPKVLKGHDDHVITCLQFSGNTIVSGSDDNTLKVWNATTSKCMRTLTGHTGGVWSSQMKDNIIVSGSTDRMLRVWDAETGECTQTLYGHTSTVRCLHLHDNIVVSGSRDATLRVWDVTSGSCQHVLVGHVAAVRCVQYNGKLVVSGAYDFMVKVWNPEREECLHTLQGHSNRVYSLQFDGVHVVSGSLDTTIRVWDVESGTCRHTLMGHQSLTSGMELHNNILISGNADSTVKVWDIITGQCLQTLSGET